jgi:hypothetical protein
MHNKLLFRMAIAAIVLSPLAWAQRRTEPRAKRELNRREV